MITVKLGNTGIVSGKNAFGALPIQRISEEAAVKLLRKAYDNGFTFFDTARFYTDSEKKIGLALSDVREKIFIATKTMAADPETFRKELDTSLKALKTDYIDVYQFHNRPYCPKPGDGTGLYEAMLEAKAAGKIRHIGITNHRLKVAIEAAESGLYETIQFPFSYLASEEEKKLVHLCREKNIGFIAMKALAGGLINNSRAAFAGLSQYDNVLPIWGIQRESELDEFIAYNDNPPALDGELKAQIMRDIDELKGGFCRGCGYCMPSCPKGIDIANVARMILMLRRAPIDVYTTPEFQKKVALADECIGCGECAKHCPYGLDTPSLIRENYLYYTDFVSKMK